MAASVAKSNLVSGRLARAFDGATTIAALFPGSENRVARRLHANGAVTVTGVDDVNVPLPDYGPGYIWDLQFIAIVDGAGIAVL
jgi:hypothetical protein